VAEDPAVEGAGEGVVDDADLGCVVYAEAERDADVWVGVNKIRCAIDWVDDEGWGGGDTVTGVVCFFAYESGVNVSFCVVCFIFANGS